MNGFLSRLFGGENGTNLIRLLIGGVLGAFGIENGAGGDIPMIDTTQMGFSQILPVIMIWIVMEKLGLSLGSSGTPAAKAKSK